MTLKHSLKVHRVTQCILASVHFKWIEIILNDIEAIRYRVGHPHSFSRCLNSLHTLKTSSLIK